jgi:hypothetical protein
MNSVLDVNNETLGFAKGAYLAVKTRCRLIKKKK